MLTLIMCMLTLIMCMLTLIITVLTLIITVLTLIILNVLDQSLYIDFNVGLDLSSYVSFNCFNRLVSPLLTDQVHA